MPAVSPSNPQAQPKPELSTKLQSDFDRLLLKDAKSKVEFKPFGAEYSITLSVQIIKDYIAVPYFRNDTKYLPDDRQCMKFLMLCRSRALNPFEGDAFFLPFWDKQSNGPQWSLITAHQAFLKRAEIHPAYDGKRSGVIISPMTCKPCDGAGYRGETVCPACAGRGWYDELEGDYIPDQIGGEEVIIKGGWCRVYFKEKKNPEYQRLKLATYNKGFGVWNSDPAGMICKCAEAAALRSAFPTTLGGLYLREEMIQEENPDRFKGPDFRDKPAKVLGNGPKGSQLFTPPQAEPEAESRSVAEAPAANPPAKEEKLPDDPSDEEAEAAMGLAPTRAPAAPSPQDKPRNTALMALRNLCKISEIQEGKLLEFLNDIGLQDGSATSLEEVALQENGQAALEKANNDWKSIVKRLKTETQK